jgi:hypothetical protein
LKKYLPSVLKFKTKTAAMCTLNNCVAPSISQSKIMHKIAYLMYTKFTPTIFFNSTTNNSEHEIDPDLQKLLSV